MDRVGGVLVTGPTCTGLASGSAFLESCWLSSIGPTVLVDGNCIGRGLLDELDLLIEYLDCVVDAKALARAEIGCFSITVPSLQAGVSATGCGDPGVKNFTVGEVTLSAKPHRFGSSGAGASFVTVFRIHSAHAVTEYDSQGPTNSDIVATSSGAWLDAMVSNVGSSTLYLMFFDATTVPANGTLPLRQPLQIGAAGQTYVDLGDPGADGLSGRPLVNGLVWAASTTATTLTVDSTSSLWVTARTIALP
jgi:hypothetical protein